MAVHVRIPTTLRTLTGGEKALSVEGETVGAVLDAVEAAHPGVRERILDAEGNVQRFVNLFVDDDDVRFLQGLDTPVPDGAELAIMQAVAGG
ncbi:MAG: MoaD/ThiS family protein [Acidimicrobiia bacterium]|nr:MoaD/ThiS family protein [Acidimicrobiia bacterium]